MKLIDRIRAAAKVSGRILTLPVASIEDTTNNGAAIKLLSGEWEGGENSRFRRTRNVRLVAQDTDLNNGTREAIMSEARKLCQNTPIPGAILTRFGDYCVHPQAKVKFFTSDHEWNDLASDYWHNWTRACDATGEMTFPQMLRVGIISAKRDGDVFFHKEFDEGGNPRLRGIEADRITNAKFGATSFDIPMPSNVAREVGGVLVDGRGRKTGYIVCDRTGYGTFKNPKTKEASEFLHYRNTTRFESFRGVSAFHSVLNDLQDLKESKEAEQLAQKIASSHTLIERNATGSAMGPQAFSDGATDNAGNVQKLEDMAAGIKRYIAHGDSLEMFASTRPDEGWRWLIEFLIRGTSIGLDLPFEFTWNLSGLTGTSVRLVSKLAERTFNGEMDNLEQRVIDPTVAWVITHGMDTGRLPFNPEWYFYRAARPSHPTVDVGRESSANLSELNAGVRTEEQICSEQGLDSYDVRTARAGEVQHRIDLARALVSKNPEMQFQQALAMMGGANIGPTYNMQPAIAPQLAPVTP